jgi:hypothetical protein
MTLSGLTTARVGRLGCAHTGGVVLTDGVADTDRLFGLLSFDAARLCFNTSNAVDTDFTPPILVPPFGLVGA